MQSPRALSFVVYLALAVAWPLFQLSAEQVFSVHSALGWPLAWSKGLPVRDVKGLHREGRRCDQTGCRDLKERGVTFLFF